MKYSFLYKYFLFAVVMFSGCISTSKTKSRIKGNWRTCSKDGVYIEMYISDTTISFKADNGISYRISSYLINKNILQHKMIDSNYSKVSITKKAVVFIKGNSTMIWEYQNPYEKWEFSKLIEVTNLSSAEQLNLQSFLLRSEKYKCVDKRNKTEIIQDSINRTQFKF